MGSFRLRVVTTLVIASAFVGAVGASGATFGATAKSPVCSLGQKSTKAKPCKANPAYGAGACASLVSLLQPLAPGVSIVGTNRNPMAPIGISCSFLANGQRQSFMIQVAGPAANARANYASSFQQYSGYAADKTVTCQDPSTLASSPQAALQTVSGLGDKGFAWESCPPPDTGYILAAGVKGSTYAYVYANPFRVAPSLAQVEGVVKQLLSKYH